MKFWWKYSTTDMNARQLCMKIPKKGNKIIEPFITSSYLWHVNTSNCAYWIDIHSVKVWRNYILPNSNAVNSFDIIFRHRSRSTFLPCPNKESRRSKIGPVWAVDALQMTDWQMTTGDRQNSEITDRQTFLRTSEVAKIVEICFYLN